VKNLDKALQSYETLFRLKPYNRWEFTDTNLNSAFVRIGSGGIQLAQPTTTKGIIAETMEEIGEGIAYAVLMTDNIKEFAKSMEAKGIETPQSTVGGKPVAWVPRKYTHGILYQVIEPGDYFPFFKQGRLYDV
jgi:4-hydroxyphenylpyruvate dioxygenase-like putative hemolysin